MTNQPACRSSRGSYSGSYTERTSRPVRISQGYSTPRTGYTTPRPSCPSTEREEREREICNTVSGSCFTSEQFPIGMTYVPMQNWENIYCPSNALEQGTLFADLDKPFLGRRVSR